MHLPSMSTIQQKHQNIWKKKLTEEEGKTELRTYSNRYRIARLFGLTA